MTFERALNSKTKRDEVRPAARKALAQLLEPLTGFVMDSGMSIQEFSALVRHAAVHGMAAQQLEVAKRVNISGIAAATGISRADVSKILKTKENADAVVPDRHQQSTNKILSVWNQDPKFTAPNGQPADLKIYGRGATFEALVRSYGRGIPTRAILDELVRMGAVELRSAQAVRLKTSLVIDKGFTAQGIKAFGDRVTELMTTLLQNMRRPENPMFVANVSGLKISPNELPLFRKEIAKRSSDLLTEMQDILVRTPSRSRIKNELAPNDKISITIYYHEPDRTPNRSLFSPKRRNFSREV